MRFCSTIKSLLDTFLQTTEKVKSDIAVRDCDDAINIVKPIAQHGGEQTFNVYNGAIIQQQIININTPKARGIVEDASRHKALLQFPQAERKQRVSMVWDG
jgi:hypothetical protein